MHTSASSELASAKFSAYSRLTNQMAKFGINGGQILIWHDNHLSYHHNGDMTMYVMSVNQSRGDLYDHMFYNQGLVDDLKIKVRNCVFDRPRSSILIYTKHVFLKSTSEKIVNSPPQQSIFGNLIGPQDITLESDEITHSAVGTHSLIDGQDLQYNQESFSRSNEKWLSHVAKQSPMKGPYKAETRRSISSP